VKRKAIVVSVIVLLAVLMSSSMMAISQAWFPVKAKPEYVSYDLKVVYGPPASVNVDNSGAPDHIIIDHTVGALECTVTIDDKVYSYPDDFDVAVTHHVEFSAITGKGLSRSVGTFTFNLPGHPTLTFWGAARLTDFRVAPDGTFISPENFRSDGNFKLTGTKKLSNVDGFGLGEVYFAPPEYTHQYAHQFGFIKDWAL
jgi:hypothetical protein